MAMIDLLAALTGSSRDGYFGALPRLRDFRSAAAAARVAFAIQAAEELARRGEVSEHEQAERFTAILDMLGSDPESHPLLARGAAALPRRLKNAVALMIPAELRPLLDHRAAAPVSVPQTTAPAPTAITPPAGPPIPIAEGWSTVFLLSREDDQTCDRNKRLLQIHHFGSVRLDSREKLTQALGDSWDVSGCVVDRSFLTALDREGQMAFFEELARFSTFLWIRIQEEGLLLDCQTLQAVIKRSRCQHGPVDHNQLAVQKGGELSEWELGYMINARETLRTDSTARFIPEEIDDAERMVLLAAARQFASEFYADANPTISALPTRFLGGGRSGAKIALITVDRQRVPVVAKIDKKPHVLDEMDRFMTFIAPWDNELSPRVYLHGDVGVIIFGLVRGEAASRDPAPHLEDRLNLYWTQEIFEFERLQPSEEQNIIAGLRNAAAILCDLNSRRCPSPCNHRSYANPDVGHLRKLEGRNIRWDFDDGAFQARDRAMERYRRLGDAAIVHGDIQLRNILVRGDRDAHLIDYAGSGPGHPAIDLVRFELMLFVKCFKQKQHEDGCSAFQVALTLQGATAESLLRDFPLLLASSLNRICMYGCIAARDGALRAVTAHRGDRGDYLAAKYLAAWQYLIIDGFQGGLARSVISALAPAALAL